MKKTHVLFLIVFSVALFFGAIYYAHSQYIQLQFITRKYLSEKHNSVVFLRGYCSFTSENFAIYPSKDDYENMRFGKALFLNNVPSEIKNGEYYICGKLGKSRGHMGAYAGSIDNVIVVHNYIKAAYIYYQNAKE